MQGTNHFCEKEEKPKRWSLRAGATMCGGGGGGTTQFYGQQNAFTTTPRDQFGKTNVSPTPGISHMHKSSIAHCDIKPANTDQVGEPIPGRYVVGLWNFSYHLGWPRIVGGGWAEHVQLEWR